MYCYEAKLFGDNSNKFFYSFMVMSALQLGKYILIVLSLKT